MPTNDRLITKITAPILSKQPTDNFLTKEYQVGVNRSGQIVETTSSTEFTSSAEDTDFIAQRINKNIKIRFDNWNPADKDFFKFYIIPQTNSANIFYISNATIFKDISDNSFIFSEVIFSNIKDEISNSGRSINNFIQYAAPGEGFAFPKISSTGANDEPKISLDDNRLLDKPIDELQVEFYGNVVLNSVYAMGRKTANTFNDKTNKYEPSKELRAPHLIFPHKATAPRTDELSRTSGIEGNYYLLTGAEADMTTYWTDWKEKIAAYGDYSKLKNYEGTLITNVSKTKATNDTATKRSFWDAGFTFNLTDFSYGNTEWNPYVKSDEIIVNGNLTVSDFNFFNAVCNMEVEKLPLSITQSTVWSIKDIPIIGGFLNTITFGLVPTWANSDKVIAAKLINGFISCISYDFNATGIEALEGRLVMEMFKNDTQDDIGALLGTNSLTSGFRFKLTDELDDNGTVKNTINLAQDIGKNGFTIDANTRPVDPKLEQLEGYILDLINIKTIGKCDYKITAYSKGSPVYSAKFQTRGKFAGAIREYSNTIKLSNWKEETGQYIDFPEQVIPPNPNTGENLPNDFIINLTANSLIGTDTQADDNYISMIKDLKDMFNLTLDEMISSGYKSLKFEIETTDNGGNSGVIPIFETLENIKNNAPVWDGTSEGILKGLELLHNETNSYPFTILYSLLTDPTTPISKDAGTITNQVGAFYILKKTTGEYFVSMNWGAGDILFNGTGHGETLITDPTQYEQNGLPVFKNKIKLIKASII